MNWNPSMRRYSILQLGNILWCDRIPKNHTQADVNIIRYLQLVQPRKWRVQQNHPYKVVQRIVTLPRPNWSHNCLSSFTFTILTQSFKKKFATSFLRDIRFLDYCTSELASWSFSVILPHIEKKDLVLRRSTGVLHLRNYV